MLARPRTPILSFSRRGRSRARDDRSAAPSPGATSHKASAQPPAHSESLGRLLRRDPHSPRNRARDAAPDKSQSRAVPDTTRASSAEWVARPDFSSPGGVVRESLSLPAGAFGPARRGRAGAREVGALGTPSKSALKASSLDFGSAGAAAGGAAGDAESAVASGDSVVAETASLSSSSLRLPSARRGRAPAQLHVEALGLPSAYSSHVYARLTLHGDTMAVTEDLSSQNPIFSRPFSISPPHAALESRRGRGGGPPTSEPASVPILRSSRSAAARDLDRIYVVHLHCHACGDVPFASVPLPLRELADAPGQRFLIPIFEPWSSLLQSSSMSSGTPGGSGAGFRGSDSEEHAQLAITYEPLVPGGEGLVADKRISLNVRVSALKRRGKMLNSRVPLVIAVYRQTAPAPPVRPRWVLISLTAPASKPHHGSRYVQTPSRDIPYAHACNGDIQRPIRITLYQIDSTARFRVIGFHQTTLADLEKAAIVGGQPQSLQGGRYVDDRIGTLRVVAAPDSDEPRALRVMIQVDLASTKNLVSATYKPSAHSAAAAQVAAAARAAANEPKNVEEKPPPLKEAEPPLSRISLVSGPPSSPTVPLPSNDEGSTLPTGASHVVQPSRNPRMQSAEWRMRSSGSRPVSPMSGRPVSPAVSLSASPGRPASPALTPVVTTHRAMAASPIPAPLPPSRFSDGSARTASGGSGSGISAGGSNGSGPASAGLVDISAAGSGRNPGWADRERTPTPRRNL